MAHLTQRGTRMLLRSGAVLAVLALIGVAAVIWRMRAVALDDARRETGSLAFVLAEQTTRSLQAINIVLENLSSQLLDMAAGSGDDFEAKLRGQQVFKLLTERASQLPQAQVLAIVGASGDLLNLSRGWPAPTHNFSNRDYFRMLSGDSPDDTVISEPVRAATTGAWTVYLAHRLRGPDGRLLAIITAGLDIGYIQSLFDSVHLPHGSMFFLLRRDGTVLANYPREGSTLGRRLPPGSTWYQVVANGGGHFLSAGKFTHSARLVASQLVRDFPLVLDISVSEDAVLGAWRRDALILGTASLLVIAFGLVLLRMHDRQLRRIQQSEAHLMRRNEELAQITAQLGASEARLSQKSAQLHTTLATMDQGLLMIDGTGRVVVFNDRALELLDMPHSFMAANPLFKDMLEFQWDQNRSGKEETSFEEFLRKRMVFHRPYAHELRRPNGRVVEVRSVPLRDGGAVRTYTDITERKACEDRSLYFAHHDDLTRLVNRLAFKERLEQALVVAGNDRRGLALFYLDLDRFKLVNDGRGHGVGDALLVEAAQRMQLAVRSVDTVARIGGDEFTIILPYLEEHESAARLSERLIESLNRPFEIDGAPVSIGVSIGVAFFPQDALTSDGLMQRADEALYAAKSGGRNTFRFATGDAPPRQSGNVLALPGAPA